MKKSNALLLVIFFSMVFYFTNDNVIEQIILKINITILTVGYFIVKQLEENRKDKNINHE